MCHEEGTCYFWSNRGVATAHDRLNAARAQSVSRVNEGIEAQLGRYFSNVLEPMASQIGGPLISLQINAVFGLLYLQTLIARSI